MFTLCHAVFINNLELNNIVSVETNKSVETLSDTAKIVVVLTSYNKRIVENKKIAVGMPVEILLGYNNNFYNEFKGYVKEINTDGGQLTISCEDEIYTLRNTELENKVYKDIDVKDLLEKVLKQVNTNLKLNCDYSFNYSKFTIDTATAYEVVKIIADDTNADIFFENNTLHIHPVYTNIKKTINYDFAVNIDRNGLNLKYRSAEDRKLKVTAKGKDKAGKEISATVGSAGGDTINYDYKGITTTDNLKTIANEIYNRKHYEGLEGSFNSWLVPYIEPGYTANLTDKKDTQNNGNYYVLSVTTSYSSSGGVRTITIGKKL